MKWALETRYHILLKIMNAVITKTKETHHY